MRLKLNHLDVECIVGERPEERERPQRLRIEVALTVDEDAADSDRLADAVDYAQLAEQIRLTLVGARCQLIERAAKLVAELCRRQPRVRAVEASVRKFGAIPNLESAEAVYAL